MWNIIITVFILSFIGVLCWYTVVTERENKTPIFHKDNIYNKEIIYTPKKNYFDKLQYRDHDLRKLVTEYSPESSPIPRHLYTYGAWVVSQGELSKKVSSEGSTAAETRIIQSRTPRS